jgi:probable F420-dependent oxidoreductase
MTGAERRARLGGLGVRSRLARSGPPATAAQIASEIEALGYSALWVGGGDADTLEERLELLLGATTSLVIGTSVINIWAHRAFDAAAVFSRLEARYPNRLLLGFGVSHPAVVARTGAVYRRPVAAMLTYLDELDAAGLAADRRVLGALGPRMLEISRDRSIGTVPFLVAVEHTTMEREILGADALLAPTLEVVLDDDPERARMRARAAMSFHLTLPNYINNLKRIGFTDSDLRGTGSDALIDRVAVWGDELAVRQRVDAHRGAGADHVVLEVVTEDASIPPFDAWQRLASAPT